MPGVGIIDIVVKLMDGAFKIASSSITWLWKKWKSPERVRLDIYRRALLKHLKIESRDKDRKRKLKQLLKHPTIEEGIHNKELLVPQKWRRISETVEDFSLGHQAFSYHKFWRSVRDEMLRVRFNDEARQIAEGMNLNVENLRGYIDHVRKQSHWIGDTSEEVDALLDLAFVDRRDGSYTSAIERYREALSIAQREGASELAKLVGARLAEYLAYQGGELMQSMSFEPAYDSFREASQIADAIVDDDEDLKSKVNKVMSTSAAHIRSLHETQAKLFLEQGKLEPAEQQLIEAIPSRRLRERAQRRVGYVQEEDNDEQAKRFRIEKLSIAKDIEDEAASLGKLGMLYAQQQRFDEAIGYFNRAIDVWLGRKAIVEAKEFTDKIAALNDEVGVEFKWYLALKLEDDKQQLKYAFSLFNEVAEISEHLGDQQRNNEARRKAAMIRDELLYSTGRSFLSYRRSRKHEAELLIAAQHDLGIPTWQDVKNLDEEQTEGAIRRVLGDPTTANAILWLTPEVKDSVFIRRVEAPLILERAKQQGERDGFFVIPVLAGGLDYGQVGEVLDQRFSLEDLRMWNLRKFDADPIGPAEAAEVAKRVLNRRLTAIRRSLPEGEPLQLELFTRPSVAFKLGTALLLDWVERFDGRLAKPGAWEEHLLPALKEVADAVQTRAPGRTVEVSGWAAIPAATALGCSFLAPRGVRIAWRQPTPGRDDQLWSINVSPERAGFRAETINGEVSARDLAVLVSVATNVEPAFGASREDLPPFRAIIRVAKPGTDKHDLANAGQAHDVAQVVIDGIRRARNEYRQLGCIHLFMSVPVGLAMMIGQLLNTLGEVQTYEHIPVDAVGRYHPAALLHPSE